MRIKTTLLAFLTAIGLMLGSTVASAQAPQQQPPGGQPQAMDVSDEDVNNFVDAYISVQEINQEYTQRLQDVDDPEQATELQQEAQNKMQEAISDAGLSISEYQQIANQAGQDEQLRNQIEEALTSQIEGQQ
ncbi:DUF4168 domain-containing protein [Marinimicrobium sp. ABcell2]|uniref:DUF4168 domain-containing protein n=1 Tax=Marinimicrobium sp. ABcell2 TaxID=3069751 RepID=UPI0027B5DBB3|nr:DUF4168 domain-containing protein [Marinimicrobium sp. ABcell2]MDQ2076592.1 DUF4168 domain-containing protein [Marinimicrobium sp. ABcell2]